MFGPHYKKIKVKYGAATGKICGKREGRLQCEKIPDGPFVITWIPVKLNPVAILVSILSVKMYIPQYS